MGGRSCETVEFPHDDDVELTGAGVGHHPVERGQGVLGPAHALVDVDLDQRPPARLREATEGVYLEPEVLVLGGAPDRA